MQVAVQLAAPRQRRPHSATLACMSARLWPQSLALTQAPLDRPQLAAAPPASGSALAAASGAGAGPGSGKALPASGPAAPVESVRASIALAAPFAGAPSGFGSSPASLDSHAMASVASVRHTKRLRHPRVFMSPAHSKAVQPLQGVLNTIQ
jgi:hypothetical protein